MAVYPFYINTEAEGRKTPIAGGTRKADGDMTTRIYQREKGNITIPFKIRQYSTHDLNPDTKKWEHHLHTDVYYQGEVICHHITDY